MGARPVLLISRKSIIETLRSHYLQLILHVRSANGLVNNGPTRFFIEDSLPVLHSVRQLTTDL
jgi:hypothetical protein